MPQEARAGPPRFGKALVFAPDSGRCEGAVLWLHGFGDKPNGWASSLRPLRAAGLPGSSWQWIYLRALPIAQPAYGNQKVPGWGQFLSPDCIHVGKGDYEDMDAKGFYAASVAGVRREVDLLEREGVSSDRVVIGGFSQGAAVALEAAFTSTVKLGGCISIAGWLTPRARGALLAKPAAVVSTPVLLCHGTADDMVGFDCALAAVDSLNEAGVKFTFEACKGILHAACPQEFAAIATFLCKSLSPGVEPSPIAWDDSDPSLGSSDEETDTTYVSKAALKALMSKVKVDSKSLSTKSLAALQNSDKLADAEVMVPIQTDFITDMDEFIENLGEEGATKHFLQGAAQALKATAEHMSAGQWRTYLKLRACEPEEGGEEEELRDAEGTVSFENEVSGSFVVIGAAPASDPAASPATRATKRPRKS